MENVLVPLIAIPSIFIGLPWIILHYITRWKTAATLTSDDELMLEELYQLGRRLNERMDTVERLVAADNPDFQPARIPAGREADGMAISELDQLRAGRGPGRK